MCFGSSKHAESLPSPRPVRIQPGGGGDGSYASMPPVYSPPSGPPPSHAAGSSLSPAGNDFAPPPGSPPGKEKSSSGATHDWQVAVPDTSLLPPPPNLFSGWERSPTNNATEEQAEMGTAWCNMHPLSFPPLELPEGEPSSDAVRRAVANHQIGLLKPHGFRGTLEQVDRQDASRWRGQTKGDSPDTCILAYPPLYMPNVHSPLQSGQPFTVYYEVFVLPVGSSRREVSLAMGFAAMPYPSFRLPGWHRGSVGVHGDDGHRYVNDMWGGKDFLDAPLKPGSTYGIGIRFAVESTAPNGMRVDVFFTEQGRRLGSWNLHEELDSVQDRPVTGLEGFHDLSLAIGTFDKVGFEVRLAPSQWMYKGDGTSAF